MKGYFKTNLKGINELTLMSELIVEKNGVATIFIPDDVMEQMIKAYEDKQ